MSAFDLGDGSFDAVSGGVAAPKSSVVPESGDFDPFAAAQAAAVPTVATAAPLSNQTADAAPAPATETAAATPSAADSKADAKDDKPTPYSLWEAKKKQQLAEKQQKADELKKAAVATAKQDIAKFLAARDERIAQRKIENRAEEKSAAAATKQVMGYGSHAMFEKIGKLVDTSAKSNEKRPGVDRFRKLLIQLKTTPPAHIGGAAAGAAADLKTDRS